MTAWGSSGDPTEPQPRPVATDYHTHECPERRSDPLMVALVVLLTFALSVIALLGAIYSLNGTVEHLMQIPMCQEPKK